MSSEVLSGLRRSCGLKSIHLYMTGTKGYTAKTRIFEEYTQLIIYICGRPGNHVHKLLVHITYSLAKLRILLIYMCTLCLGIATEREENHGKNPSQNKTKEYCMQGVSALLQDYVCTAEGRVWCSVDLCIMPQYTFTLTCWILLSERTAVTACSIWPAVYPSLTLARELMSRDSEVWPPWF